MRCVYLDIETYYDSDYSLKKLSIEEYVRDKRFVLNLLGVAVDDSPVRMIDAKDVPAALGMLRLHEKDCLTFVQNAKFDVFALNQRYGIDIANPICTRAMARWAGVSRLTRESLAAQCEFLGTGIKGDFIHSMRGKQITELSQQDLADYKAYCATDVIQLRDNVKAMLPCMTTEALAFIIMTTRMYTDPIFELDHGGLEAYYAKLKQAHAESQAKLQHLFQFPTQEAFLKALRSKSSFCKMLDQIGGAIPYKVSEKKTETRRKQLAALAEAGDAEAAARLAEGDYVVMEPALAKNDLAFMDLMTSDNPDIAALATARAENNSSISMSRCETFLRIAQRGNLPVPLEAYLAHTGRYTAGTTEGVKSDKVNLQNLSKRTGDKTLRQCVRAPQGYKVVACDSSQVEARVLAWLAGQQDLLEDFRTGADPYCRMAAAAYGEPYDTIWYWSKGPGAKDPQGDPALKKKYGRDRNIGKTMVLQLGYYSGGSKLATYMAQQGVMLKPTKEEHDAEAKRLVKVYRSTNWAIKQFWGTCDSVLQAMLSGSSGYFGGPEGRTFYYDGKHKVVNHAAPGIMFPDGYWLVYNNLRTEYDEEQKRPVMKYDIVDAGKKITKQLHSGILCNNVTQGLAFAIMRWQALQINKWYPIRINIHDSWGIVVPEQEAQAALDCMTHWMRQLPLWAMGLPVDCEGDIGDDFTIV